MSLQCNSSIHFFFLRRYLQLSVSDLSLFLRHTYLGSAFQVKTFNNHLVIHVLSLINAIYKLNCIVIRLVIWHVSPVKTQMRPHTHTYLNHVILSRAIIPHLLIQKDNRQKCVILTLVICLGGLSLPRNNASRLTDHPYMT